MRSNLKYGPPREMMIIDPRRSRMLFVGHQTGKKRPSFWWTFSLKPFLFFDENVQLQRVMSWWAWWASQRCFEHWHTRVTFRVFSSRQCRRCKITLNIFLKTMLLHFGFLIRMFNYKELCPYEHGEFHNTVLSTDTPAWHFEPSLLGNAAGVK